MFRPKDLRRIVNKTSSITCRLPFQLESMISGGVPCLFREHLHRLRSHRHRSLLGSLAHKFSQARKREGGRADLTEIWVTPARWGMAVSAPREVCRVSTLSLSGRHIFLREVHSQTHRNATNMIRTNNMIGPLS